MAKEGGATPIGAGDFEQEVLRAPGPVLVDFHAAWCGPCHALAPTLDELARDLAGRARVVKLDVDEAPDLARQYQVSSIPCLVVFKGGREVGRLVGAVPKRRIAGALQAALAA
ncbi:MAG TPA: thioredoxin [Anaeromyxobacteraceae bacterium]